MGAVLQYFLYVKLEKITEVEGNEWNFLVLIYKNVEFENGDVSYSYSMNSDELRATKKAVNRLSTLMEELSGGLMDVRDFDVVEIDEPFSSYSYSETLGYYVDPEDPAVSAVLDSYIDEKRYDQIIVIDPANSLSGFGGLGGRWYRGAGFCQISYVGWFVSDEGKDKASAPLVHEICHCLESKSNSLNSELTGDFHDNEKYGYYGDDEYEYLLWYKDYMQGKVNGQYGVVPETYTHILGVEYSLVEDGMDCDFTVPMYRLYNPNSSEHFYTSDENEKAVIVSAGWKYEGVAWTAPVTSMTPVYRLYNANAGEHHYTTDLREKSILVGLGWKDEGIGWYSDDSKTVAVKREYNPNAYCNNHNYTTDENEHSTLVSVGWKDEGIGWYALSGRGGN